MRSLWRMLALQWLGGEGSEALTDDSAVFDILMVGSTKDRPALSMCSVNPGFPMMR